MTEPIAYKITDAAKAVSVSESTIRQAIQATDPTAFPPPLVARKFGREYRIEHTDLLAWVRSMPTA